jgi:protein-S-isoprenylcysteine O-methyltransferase Ste14
MTRPVVALALLAAFLGVTFGLRALRHHRATGSTGFRGISGRVGSAQWTGGVLFVAGLVFAAIGPIVELARAESFDAGGRDLFGLGLMIVSAAGVWWAQSSMGASWRVGVDASERTELVMAGPFRWVRNPIFSFVLLATGGLVVYLPNAWTLAALVSLAIAVELQVRFAEEPYLRRVHGERYAEYCRRVGRFVPGIGRALDSRGAPYDRKEHD